MAQFEKVIGSPDQKRSGKVPPAEQCHPHFRSTCATGIYRQPSAISVPVCCRIRLRGQPAVQDIALDSQSIFDPSDGSGPLDVERIDFLRADIASDQE